MAPRARREPGALTGSIRFVFALLLAAAGAAQAGSLRYCDRPARMSVEQQDVLFRFAGVVKRELEQSGQPLALMARSGLDLSLVGQRYSHAGISLQASPNGPWSVRQLYYACDEGRPRIFDQGMSGFLIGTDKPDIGYLSLVFLPAEAAAALEDKALSSPGVLALLAADYSANAYPFSLRYQNCNQWVMELLASAWGSLPLEGDGEPARERAQGWLLAQGYQPTQFDLWPPLMWLSAFVPWLHRDDHPEADLANAIYRVSMPASIEAFARVQWPEARRVELCHAGRRVVIHRGWSPVGEGCEPGEGDEVVALD